MSLSLTNSKIIDIAIVGQLLASVETKDNYHIVELDNISISKELFKAIFFYHDNENFSIIPNAPDNDEIIQNIISFESNYRTYDNGVPFNLLNVMFSFMEDDLNLKRDCFDTCCKMELEKQLSLFKTLCDLDICNVLCSLKWSEIIEILNSKGAKSIDSDGNKIPHLLKINIVFKNPNTNIKDIIIKFNYVLEYIDELSSNYISNEPNEDNESINNNGSISNNEFINLEEY
tara:strand:- start:1753 stop:2445 length:693 start_codon:yes stop_codon:yes gene_type:complete